MKCVKFVLVWLYISRREDCPFARKVKEIYIFVVDSHVIYNCYHWLPIPIQPMPLALTLGRPRPFACLHIGAKWYAKGDFIQECSKQVHISLVYGYEVSNSLGGHSEPP